MWGGASEEPLWNDGLRAGVCLSHWYTVYVVHRAWRMSQEKFPVETAGQLLLAQSGGGTPSRALQELLLTGCWGALSSGFPVENRKEHIGREEGRPCYHWVGHTCSSKCHGEWVYIVF